MQWNNLLLINLEKYEDVYNLSLGMAKTHFFSDAGGCRFAAEKMTISRRLLFQSTRLRFSVKSEVCREDLSVSLGMEMYIKTIAKEVILSLQEIDYWLQKYDLG